MGSTEVLSQFREQGRRFSALQKEDVAQNMRIRAQDLQAFQNVLEACGEQVDAAIIGASKSGQAYLVFLQHYKCVPNVISDWVPEPLRQYLRRGYSEHTGDDALRAIFEGWVFSRYENCVRVTGYWGHESRGDEYRNLNCFRLDWSNAVNSRA